MIYTLYNIYINCLLKKLSMNKKSEILQRYKIPSRHFPKNWYLGHKGGNNGQNKYWTKIECYKLKWKIHILKVKRLWVVFFYTNAKFELIYFCI